MKKIIAGIVIMASVVLVLTGCNEEKLSAEHPAAAENAPKDHPAH